MQNRHPGFAESPLPFSILSEWDDLVEETLLKLENCVDLYDFYMIMSCFISNLDDGHSNIYLNEPAKEILPFDFAIIDTDLYIINTYNEQYSNLLFSSISTINGISTEQLLNKAREYCFTDYSNSYWLERLNSPLLIMLHDKRFYNYIDILEDNYLEIEFLTQDHSIEYINIEFENIDEKTSTNNLINLQRNNITMVTHIPYSFKYIENIDSLYLQINSLPTGVDRKFIKEVFNECKNKNVENLILDLRNNQGGNSSWSTIFYSYIVDSKKSLSIYNGWRRDSGVNKSFFSLNNITPKQPNFDGDLYILTSGRTMSSANFFVIGALDNNLGTVIGTPTGNNNVRYGYTNMVPLPNTDLLTTSSLRIWQRTTSEPEQFNMPITPDHIIDSTIDNFILNSDPQYDYLISILENS